MFHKSINKTLSLTLLMPQHAPSLFALTDQNRHFLGQWLPWVNSTVQEKDTEKFIKEQHKLYCEGKALHAAIEFKDKIIGVIGYDEVDSANDIGHLGYWLGEEFNGNGFMTMATREMVSIGFNDYALNRIEIQCATANTKSKAIPERLGFVQEGILRSSEKVNGQYLDLVVYSLLKGDAIL